MPGVAVLVRLPRVFLLQPPRVGEDDATEILRARRAEHAAAESARDEPREVAGVVHVGVGEHDRVDGGRVDRQGIPVAPPQLAQTLEQAAVHEDPLVLDLEQVLRACHRPRRSEEGQLRHAETLSESARRAAGRLASRDSAGMHHNRAVGPPFARTDLS